MAQGFYDDNQRRNYPFPDDSDAVMTRTSDGAAILLPYAALVDFGCMVGPDAKWAAGDDVYLAKVTRSGAVFTFEFAATAAGLAARVLRFTRNIADAEFATSRASAVQLSDGTLAHARCNDPLVWDGFLATGSLANLAALIAPGDAMTATRVTTAVEPTLIQDLAGSYVRSINLVNYGRVVSLPPAGCNGTGAGTSGLGTLHIAATCIHGTVTISPGYNSEARQAGRTNSIVITGRAGAGGSPCAEVPAYPGEVSPDGGTLLTGGSPCSSLIGRINAASGATLRLVSGPGVTITGGGSTPHQVIIDFNLGDLAACAPLGSSIGHHGRLSSSLG